MLNKMLLTIAALMLSGAAFAAADAPSGYTKCAKLGSTCAMTGTHKVAIGKSGKFAYKTATGNFACDLAGFPGAPANSIQCSYQPGTTSAATPSSPPAANVGSGSTTTLVASDLCVAGGVIDGKEVDCGGKTLSVASTGAVGCNSDKEGQPAVLSLKNGAIVKNLHVAAGGGGHGISCLSGNCTLQNVTWDEVCEHAAGNYSVGGTFTIKDSTAYQNLDSKPIDGNSPDKFFQDNAKNSIMVVTNFTAIMVTTDGSIEKKGKILRTCGDCSNNQGGRTLILDGLTVKHQDTKGNPVAGPGLSIIAGVNDTWDASVPKADAIPDKAVMRNIRIQGYDGKNVKICDTYVGTRIHNKSTHDKEKWNTPSCDVSRSDVTGF